MLCPFIENAIFVIFEDSRIGEKNSPLILTIMRVSCICYIICVLFFSSTCHFKLFSRAPKYKSNDSLCVYNRQNTGLDLGDALKSQVCPPTSWVALGKSLCLSRTHFLIGKMIPSVSMIVDLGGNKRSCVNAREVYGIENPVFCPLHSFNISQLKVLGPIYSL